MYDTTKSHFIETVQLILSDQEVLDEFKNNYYAFIAQDPDATTTDGMEFFATEWINTFIDNNPDFKDVSEVEIHIVKWWIIDKILFPIALHIDMAKEAKELKEARLEASLKNRIKRAIAAIRKALSKR